MDMAESIRKIEKYTSRGKEAFDRDELLHVWIVHHLQILGEAARGNQKNHNSDIIKSRGRRS